MDTEEKIPKFRILFTDILFVLGAFAFTAGIVYVMLVAWGNAL
jgi:hypothetical protein